MHDSESKSLPLSNSNLLAMVRGLVDTDLVAPGQRKLAVLVAGMHRSGTSAVAGSLAALGIPMGLHLMPATQDNPKGYFEDLELVAMHEAILGAFGRRWNDPRTLPVGWLDLPAVREVERAMANWIDRTFGDAPLFALKDPRISRFLPLWQRILRIKGVHAQVLHVIRHPAEVAASLFAREAMPPTVALLLWCSYNVDIAAHRALMPTMVLRYPDDIFSNLSWLPDAIATRLGLDPAAMTAGAKEFLEPGLQRQTSHDFESGVLPSLVDIALSLDAAIQDQRPDLDDILMRWRGTIAPLLDEKLEAAVR